jgi:DNA-directed RNA polymerase subunit M/transcription elongation factor TFIIS
MKFCGKCSNMFYTQVAEDGAGIVYYCRQCGNSDTDVDADDMCLATAGGGNGKDFHRINRFTKFDPTLPRTNKMKCPHPDCGQDKDTPSNIIYIKHNDVEMKFVYMCCVCDTHWTTDVK